MRSLQSAANRAMVRSPTRWVVYLRLGILGVIWGSSFLAQKIALQTWSYQQIVVGRMLGAAVVLVVMMLARGERLPGDRRFWLVTAVGGVLIGVSNLLVPFALVQTPSGLSGVLMATIPLFSMSSMLALLRHERPTTLQATGLFTGFAGAVIAIGPWRQSFTGGSILGVALLLIAAGLLGVNSTYARRFLSARRESGLVLMTATMIAGALIMVVLIGPITTQQRWTFSLASTLAVLYIGALPTGLAYVLLFGLIRDVGVARATSANYLIPVVAVVLGAVALHEALPWTVVVGGLIVLTGVGLTEGRVAPRDQSGASSKSAPRSGLEASDHR